MSFRGFRGNSAWFGVQVAAPSLESYLVHARGSEEMNSCSYLLEKEQCKKECGWRLPLMCLEARCVLPCLSPVPSAP